MGRALAELSSRAVTETGAPLGVRVPPARETFSQEEVLTRVQFNELLPALVRLKVALAAKPATEEGRYAQSLLKNWNGEARVDSAAPLAFSAWYRELTRLVYADELGDMFSESWDMRAAFMLQVMKGQNGYERWCDDVRTPVKETCAIQAAKAFDLAAAYLTKHAEHGDWRWGKVHVAAGDHRPFSFVPVISKLWRCR